MGVEILSLNDDSLDIELLEERLETAASPSPSPNSKCPTQNTCGYH